MITHKQLSLADIFTDCQNKFDHDKYQFLELLENTIKGSVITAYLLNSNHIPLDYISEIFSGITGFLWLCCRPGRI